MNSRRTFLFFSILLCFGLNGCVLSLQPLFTDKEQMEQIQNPELEGVWHIKAKDEEKKNEGTFTLRWFPDGKLYVLQTELKDQPKGIFNAVLGNIGTNRFLQIVPQKPDSIHTKSFYGGHFIQAFSFWKVQIDKDSLALTPLNYEWVERMDKAKKLDIKHDQQPGGFIILTASTEELKSFVLKYSNDKAAFSDGLSFERKK